MGARPLKGLVMLAAAVATLAPAPAEAWGGEGHSIIAQVAYDALPAELKARMDAIRAAASIHYEYDHRDRRTGQMVHEVCRADTLAELASWADCVRYDPGPHFSPTGAYHFDDIPFCGEARKSDWCGNGQCGSAALVHYAAVLHDPATQPQARLEALAFVIHIVGDLHQPLHTIDNRDSGGNGITITVGGQVSNLHSFWDSGFIRLWPTPAAAQQAVAADAASHAAAWGQDMNPDNWVQASHAIAVQAYRTLDHAPQCNVGHWDAGGLDANYIHHFGPIVQDQLAMAAVRLRNLLATTLS
jgi:hypothetical protein